MTAERVSRPAHRIVLDTDIGSDVDDAIALLVAAASPELELALVTTVTGRAHVRARMARKLLEAAGRSDVEVVAGRSRPLRSDVYEIDYPDGLWMGHEAEGLLDPHEMQAEESSEPVVVVDLVEALDDETTVVTIGPLTNLAALLREHPDAVGRWVAMAGCMEPLGAGEALPGDYNVNGDRQAAHEALHAGLSTLLVPLDVTIRTYLTDADHERLRSGPPALRALAAMIDRWKPIFAGMRPEVTGDDWVCHLHDPLAVATAVRPDLVRIEPMRIEPRTRDGTLLTVPVTDGGVPLDVVTDVDVEGLRKFVLERLWALG